MGTIKQGILGGFSGKVGTVIGGTWKGISYMRGLALSIANPQTDAQLDQRQKWSVTMHFLKPVTQFLRTGFKNLAIKMTAFNAAVSYNIQNAISGAYPNYAIDYPNALLAKGNLASALNQVATSTVAGTVKFDWQDNSGEIGASALDKTLLVVYNPTQNQAVTVSGLTARADLTQTITVPSSFSGDLVECYMAFITADGQTVSNSAFAGAVTVA